MKQHHRNEHFYAVLICAVRYCLGRRTYMPELVTSWIMSNASDLPRQDAKTMLRDIAEQRALGERLGTSGLGDPCDVRVWERFEEWLKGKVDA